MPTGGEKTVCDTVLRFIPPGVTIAVTPLIALIVDQCNACIGLDLMCYLLSSTKDKGKMVVWHYLTMPNQSNKFLFTTPKTITTSNDKYLMQIMTANNTLAQFFIDKAHCIDCWGFNFCPSYSSLGSLKDYGVPIVVLSTRYVMEIYQNVVKYCLEVRSRRNCQCFSQFFNRFCAR